MADWCIFKDKYGEECDDECKLSTNLGSARIHSIIQASKVYGDGIHLQLAELLANEDNPTIHYHKNCVSRYVSSTNLKHKVETHEESSESPKKLRRSDKLFNFRKDCLYCGPHKSQEMERGIFDLLHTCRKTFPLCVQLERYYFHCLAFQ